MPTKHPWKAIAASVITGALALGGAATAATAAPPHATEATLTDVRFVESTVTEGSDARIQGSWSLPDSPATPAGFVVPLPEALQGRTDAFPLLDPAGVAMGSCVVDATSVTCDIDEGYIAEHPRNLQGTFFFWVSVRTEVTEATEVTYDFGSVEGTVTVTPQPGGCTDCEFTGRSAEKRGRYDREADVVRWTIDVQSPVEGMAGGQTVTITDRLGANQRWFDDGGVVEARVWGTNERGSDGYPVGWHDVTDQVGAVTTLPDGDLQVVFETQRGWYYGVEVVTSVTDAGAAVTYENTADILVEGQASVPVSAQVVRQGGGGTGSGDGVGVFRAAKVLTGDGAGLVASDATFELAYSYPAGDGFAAGQGVLTLPADGTVVTSPELPIGAVVTLEELAPAAVDGATWAAPVLSATEVVIGQADAATVTVTNAITRVPPPPTESTPPPTTPAESTPPTPPTESTPPTTPALPRTGGEPPVLALVLGAVLVAAGALVAAGPLVALRHRAESQQR